MNLPRIRDLVAEMTDSLPDLIDVAEGIEGPNKANVVKGLKLLNKQAMELEQLTKEE